MVCHSADQPSTSSIFLPIYLTQKQFLTASKHLGLQEVNTKTAFNDEILENVREVVIILVNHPGSNKEGRAEVELTDSLVSPYLLQ